MKEDDEEAPTDRLTAANDNEPATQSPAVDVDAALTHIAEAIGRHIAREHIRACRPANDNQPRTDSSPFDP